MVNMAEVMVEKVFGEKYLIKKYMSHDHSKHNHSHDKSNSHSHSHSPANFGKAFMIAIGLNMTFVVVEIFYGFLSNSTALIADATHNFGDVLGLFLAFGAYKISKRLPNHKYTYGLKSTTILSTIISGMLLLVATGSILWEAIQRIADPAPVIGSTVILVATIGIIINSLSAYLLAKGGKDINIKSAFMHLVADALVSVGVVVAGIIIILTNFVYIDPIVSIIIAIMIIWSTWGLFKEAISLSLQAVPKDIDLRKVKEFLLNTENIQEVHDLHIWAISTTETALTCHIVLKENCNSINLSTISHDLEHHFEISHATLQIENDVEKVSCKLVSDEIV